MTKTTQTTAPGVQEGVGKLVEEVLTGTPVYLVELTVRGARGSQVVDVFVDSDEALGVDTLAEINREIAFLLETESVFSDRYRLNVSSPGLDRPLKYPRQYKKNIGRTLRVHHRKPEGDGYTEITGALTSADDETITVAASGGKSRTIHYDEILWAKVQLPW